MFNLSVLASDAFMQAVDADQPWELKFGGVTYRVLQARDLWDKIIARPIRAPSRRDLIDRINRRTTSITASPSSRPILAESSRFPRRRVPLGSVNLRRW